VRFGRIILGLCLCAGTARADWTVYSTQTGAPSNVTVFRPGYFAVATSSELYVFKDGFVTTLNKGMAGSFLRGTDCVVGIRTNGSLESLGNCSTTDNDRHLFPMDGDYEVKAVQVIENGTVGYAAASENPILRNPEIRSSLVPKEGTADWGSLPNPGAAKVSLSRLAVLPPQSDGQPQALLSVSDQSANFVWYRGTSAVSYPASGTPTPSVALSVALLPGEAPGRSLAFYGNASGLFRSVLGGAGLSVEPLLLGVGSVNALAFDPSGTGFGLMLVKQPDNKVVAYSAEPVVPPALPGTVWRRNSGLQSGLGFQKSAWMACADASYCVAVLDAFASNVIVYENKHAPDLSSLPSRIDVGEGATRVVDLKVKDDDGDAVRMTATVGAPGSAVSLQQRPLQDPDESGLQLTLTAPPGICASQDSTLEVRAFDGVAAHDRRQDVPLRVNHTVRPAPPVGARVDVPGGAFFMAGPSGTLTPQRGAVGCEPVAYTWTPVGSAPRVERSDTGVGAVRFTPPTSLGERCRAGPTVFAYQVSSEDAELKSESSSEVRVAVLPWGSPEAPFPDPKLSLFSGTVLLPQRMHLCAPSTGVPAVKTWWSVVEPSPEVTVTALQDNAMPPVGTTPVEAASLLMASRECVNSQRLKLRAFNRLTVDGHALDSAPSDIEVTVQPRWVPLNTVALGVDVDRIEERRLFGHVTAPGLNCSSMRPLSTVVTLEDVRDPSRVLATVTFAGGAGNFELNLPPTCGSATYTVRARMQEETASGPVSIETSVSRERTARDVVLGELDGTLVATCEQGARGTLRQTIPEGACTSVDLSWSASGGPALYKPYKHGDSATLASVDTQLESLVGQDVTLDVTATGEGASGVSRSHVVRIGAEPFVTVSRRTEAGPGTDSGQMGVVVTLRNDTACGVTAVRFKESVTHAQVLPQSVTLNGHPVSVVEGSDGHFVVEPVPLEAGQSATLTYVVRPALLRTPGFSSEATMRGVVVSKAEAPPPSTSGCGCSGGGSGVTAFGLGALAWAVRRRRGVRARS
jgi:uncharacterized protein (TIGR03382 family)